MKKERLMELAGIADGERRGSFKTIIVVENAKPESELGDIMFEVTPEQLFLIAKGTVEDPRTLQPTFYPPYALEDAKRDAQARLEAAKK